MGRSTTTIGCFGKLPSSPEYIMDGVGETRDSEFETWMREGLAHVKSHFGSRFDSLFGSFPGYDFVWLGAGRRRPLTGKLSPSRDSAGRTHPFALFASVEVPRGPLRGPLLAAGSASIFEHLGALLEASRAATSSSEVLQLVRNGALNVGWDERSTEERYARFVEGRPSGDFWRSQSKDATARYTVMQGFVETMEELRRWDPSDIHLALRFPLCEGEPESTHLEVAFWLDLTARRLGRSLDRVSYLWSRGGRNGFGPVLFLFFSKPSAAHWICLVDPGAESETMSFLDRPYGSEPPRARMDAATAALVGAPDATLAQYLDWARCRA